MTGRGSRGRRACAVTLALAVTAAGGPASPLSAGATQETPTFAASVESVYVDAFVTRDRQPVLGLGAASFELEDDGERQAVELVAIESLPLTVLLAFDTSGSVEGRKLAALRSASEAFLAGLRPADEIGLLAFSHEVRWLARPSPDRSKLTLALDGMRASGGTAVWDALYTALAVIDTRSRMVVILFTDGEDNMSFLGPAQVKAAAERSNALVQVVGFRPPPAGGGRIVRYVVDPPEPEHVRALRQTAEVTGGRFWEPSAPERLADAFRAIVAAMNTRYVLRYEPKGTPRPGFHRIELRLRGQKGEVHARRGYWRAGP